MNEDNNAVNTNVETVENNVETKTYTEDELNQKLKANKNEVMGNILKELGVKDFESAKKGFKSYLEQVEKDKTELEKATETITSNAAEIANLKSENNNLMLTNKALIAGVKSENISDFVAIINSRITADKTADQIIKEMKENTAYAGFFATVEKKPTGTGNPIGLHKDTNGNALSYGAYLAQKYLGNSN